MVVEKSNLDKIRKDRFGKNLERVSLLELDNKKRMRSECSRI